MPEELCIGQKKGAALLSSSNSQQFEVLTSEEYAPKLESSGHVAGAALA